MYYTIIELFMLFSLSFIYIIAPVDCRNNPLIGKPKKNYLFVILMIILCVYWGMIMINKEFAKAIFYIVNIYLVVLILGIKDSPRYRCRRKND